MDVVLFRCRYPSKLRHQISVALKFLNDKMGPSKKVGNALAHVVGCVMKNWEVKRDWDSFKRAFKKEIQQLPGKPKKKAHLEMILAPFKVETKIKPDVGRGDDLEDLELSEL